MLTDKFHILHNIMHTDTTTAEHPTEASEDLPEASGQQAGMSHRSNVQHTHMSTYYINYNQCMQKSHSYAKT